MPNDTLILYEGGNIANVERVELVTEEDTPRTIVFETSTNCSFDPAVSSGTEVEQRVKNRIMGLLRTDDILKGYDLTLEDQRLIAEALALIDGGTLTKDETSNKWTKYASPTAGSVVNRTPFALNLYTSDRSTDAEVIEYYKWHFPHCKGKPISGGAQDGQFSTLRYTVNSRPPKGTSALEVTRVETLPEATKAEAE